MTSPSLLSGLKEARRLYETGEVKNPLGAMMTAAATMQQAAEMVQFLNSIGRRFQTVFDDMEIFDYAISNLEARERAEKEGV